ncbi:PREDICTED: uncharacterized protein LOC100632341, partial [Amphimedon queenslandica]|uniref:Large ribosomal subunit protein uL24m n=1 Tax=Amphimedon queenslandica TaxID=400682 RepID=A0AAN0JRR6_AMPQE
MSWKPWTLAAARLKMVKSKDFKFPEPISRWNIVKGDLVQVLCGKDKGRNGKVVAVARRTNRIFVGGLNTHIRVMVGETARTRIASEAPLHVSNVALVDPEDGKPCRIRYQYTEDGEKVRVSKRSGRIIPKPVEVLERRDFKSRGGYVEGSKDTTSE